MKKLIMVMALLMFCGVAFAEVQEAKISFTAQEAQVAIQLFDLAVKAGGLQTAEPAVVLTKKFTEAFKMKPEPKVEKK